MRLTATRRLKARLITGIVFLLAIVCVQPLLAEEITWLTAAESEVDLSEEVVGTLYPRMVTTLSSKVMGNILEVRCHEGDTVKEGDILVRIDAKDLGSDLARSEAALNEAHAGSREIDQHLAAASSAKKSAEANLKLARDSHDRIKKLLKSGSATQQEYDQVWTKLVQAQEGVRQAISQIAALKAKKSQLYSKASQARAAMEKVSTIQALAEVRAPFSGRVTQRKVEPGMLSAPGVPLIVMENTQVLFEAIVPERLLAKAGEGKSVPVRVDAVAGDVFEGKVVEIAPSADRLSHTFVVKIAIPRDLRFRSGMYARGEIKKATRKALLVPMSAIEERGQLEGVYIEHEGKPMFRLIKKGASFDGRIEVLSGLMIGDKFAQDAAPIKKGW